MNPYHTGELENTPFSKTNYEYSPAPFLVSFLLAVELPPAVRRWSRKRRLRWRRRYVRQALIGPRKWVGDQVKYYTEFAMGKLPPPATIPILFQNTATTVFACQACAGDVTEPHTCHYAD